MSSVLKLMQREQELIDEIENLRNGIQNKQMELDNLKEMLSNATCKREQIRRFIAGDIRKMMLESQ